MSAKKSGGTPKTGSAAKKNEPEETFEYRDIVLAKLRGFPPWPAMVVDPDTVPEKVAEDRPPVKKSTIHVVRFFPTGDYSWLPPKELKRLTKDEIDKVLLAKGNDEAKRHKDLVPGYRAALNPVAWEAEKDAEAAAAPKKRGGRKKRDEDEEMEDAEEEGEDELDDDSSAGKKRKRASTGGAKTKPRASAAKGKKGGKKKSKDTVESEDDAAAEDEGGEGEAETKRPAKKAKAEKDKGDASSKFESDPEAIKVREWRHKLQKTFLNSNKTPPKEEDMPTVNELFNTVENYQNMNVDYLAFSKIGKVMRHITLLDEEKVPRDAEFRFRERAKALVDKWHDILQANKTTEGGEKEKADGEEKAEVNGHAAKAMEEGDLTMIDDSAAS